MSPSSSRRSSSRPGDEVTALLATFLAYGLGFVARPLGGIILGRVGDTHGRKTALLITIALMAIGTVMIGILPTYAAIGIAAPLLLVVARLLQGFSAGGEWGSSTAYIVEWAPQGQRGFYGSFQQTSVVAGLLLGSGIAALFDTILTTEQMDGWGWRIPFLLGGILGPVGLWMRRTIDETPAYEKAQATPAPVATDTDEPLADGWPRVRLHHRVDGVLLRAAQLHADLDAAISQDQPGGGAVGQHDRAARADDLHSGDGQAVGQDGAASRCCLPVASPTSCCPIRSSNIWSAARPMRS